MNKQIVYILIAACTIFFLSCEKTTDELSVVGKRVPDTLDGDYIVEVVFTGDDIISYNQSTFEIKLSDSAMDKLLDMNSGWSYYTPRYGVLSFYFNDKLLFKNIQTRKNDISLGPVNDLVFVVERNTITRNLYLADGFPVIRENEWDTNIEYKEVMRKVRAENAKKREVEWDIFVKYLHKKGKIVK